MYIPAAFAENRLPVLHAFMRKHSFASIITAGPDGAIASHVPVVLIPNRGEYGTLQLHVARANEQRKDLAAGSTALVMFNGPHAYVSAAWYKNAVNVPTWNYVTVHAYGKARELDDPQLNEHLHQLVATYEPADGWSMDRVPPQAIEGRRRNIVGIEIEITRLESKWKLGQNRSAEDVRGAILGLRQRGDQDSMMIAELMSAAADRV